MSSECVYQTLRGLDSDSQALVPDPENLLTVTVDGLFMDARCLPLENFTVTSDGKKERILLQT